MTNATANTIENHYSSNGWGYLKYLVIFTIASLLLFSFLDSRLFRNHTIKVSEKLGIILPEEIQEGVSFETKEGLVGQFFAPRYNTKFTLLVPSSNHATSINAKELNIFEEAKNYKLNKITGILPAFFVKYLASLIDFRRAVFEGKEAVIVNDKDILSEGMSFKDEQFYKFAIIPIGSRPALLVGFTLKNRINNEIFTKGIATFTSSSATKNDRPV